MNDTSATETTSLVEPGISIFFYRNCALKSQSISQLGVVSCEVLQSSYDNLSVETFIAFNDLEDVRRIMSQSLNEWSGKCNTQMWIMWNY